MSDSNTLIPSTDWEVPFITEIYTQSKRAHRTLTVRAIFDFVTERQRSFLPFLTQLYVESTDVLGGAGRDRAQQNIRDVTTQLSKREPHNPAVKVTTETEHREFALLVPAGKSKLPPELNGAYPLLDMNDPISQQWCVQRDVIIGKQARHMRLVFPVSLTSLINEINNGAIISSVRPFAKIG